MILVTGANGHLGRAVVEQLLQRIPADQIGVSVRNPTQATELTQRGVQVRHGDFADPATLGTAFQGATQLLIISTDVVGAIRVELHRHAINAAKEAGVQHVVYTSVVDPDPASPFAAAADHAATEAHLRESQLHYTILRNGLYAETLPLLVGAAVAGGAIEAPADGAVAYVVRADLAEATANILTQGGFVNEAISLTGGAALDLADVAGIVSRLVDRPVARLVLPDAAYRERLLEAGMPAPGADVFLGIFAAIRAGRFATVDPALGRPPVAVEAFLAKTLIAGAPVVTR